MYHEYPYTTYYGDIDKLCKCCKACKLRLDTHGDYLRLIDAKNNVLASVQVSWAEKALLDVDGNPIKSYIISAGTNGNYVVFTKGNNEVISFEVPYSITAAKDTQQKDILNYVYGIAVSADKVRITNGDGTIYEITVPFAVQAQETVDGYDLTMTAASISTDGREIVLSDTKGRELSRITPNFAVVAQKDVDNDDIKSTYGYDMTQSSTTLKLLAKDGTVLSEQTINYAVAALKDTDGNLFLSDYAEKIVVDADGKRIGVEAHDGTRLATITVPFATLSNDANNAIESVNVSGDQIILTTFDGQSFAITAPYATKSLKDDLSNTIKNTYFAGVSNDADAGTITFYDATGQILAVIQNGVITHAIYDNYDNALADYIKSIEANVSSDYLAVTHGNGTVDSIKVNYSEHAYMDSNNNVIKNTYVKRLAIVEDQDDGKWKLLAFNGDNPEALLFALEIVAERAKKDINGRTLTSYVGDIEVDALDDTVLNVLDGEDAPKKTISAEVEIDTSSITATATATGGAVTLSTTTEDVLDSIGTLPSKAADSYTPGSKAADVFVAPSLSYDAQTEEITFNPGSFTEGAYTPGSFTEGAFDPGTLPTAKQITVADGTATVTDPTINVTLAGGSQTTNPVHFTEGGV